ncbi:MAG TPA: hypothetical protein VE528_00870, partial [Thermoleophilaceae bacterium]|nr:hypothetical protein [Thermoleophilaceae bacterium]
PPPLLIEEIQSRIAAEPRLMDGMLRVLNHEVPPSQVFTRSVALATLVKALARRREGRGVLLRDARKLAVENWRRRAPSPPSPAARGA